MQKSNTRRAPAWSALQTAAILLLCRLTVFFCCPAPYTAAYAMGMLAAVLLQAALLLPLAKLRHRLQIPAPMLWIYRGFALFLAAYYAASGLRLMHMLHCPSPHLLPALFLLTLLYTVSRTQAATARTAVLLLVITAAAMLLLPVSGFRAAHAVSLYLPGNARAAFFREFRHSGELALLPVLLTHAKPQEQYAPHALTAVCIGRATVLPLTVLLGTVQNGRLTAWEGSPFFLLLARTPLSDAVRTDGFWLLLAAGCAVLCVTFALQQAIPPRARPVRAALLAVPACAGLTLLLSRTGYDGTGLGIAALLLGAALPYACLLYNKIKGIAAMPRKEV